MPRRQSTKNALKTAIADQSKRRVSSRTSKPPKKPYDEHMEEESDISGTEYHEIEESSSDEGSNKSSLSEESDDDMDDQSSEEEVASPKRTSKHQGHHQPAKKQQKTRVNTSVAQSKHSSTLGVEETKNTLPTIDTLPSVKPGYAIKLKGALKVTKEGQGVYQSGRSAFWCKVRTGTYIAMISLIRGRDDDVWNAKNGGILVLKNCILRCEKAKKGSIYGPTYRLDLKTPDASIEVLQSQPLFTHRSKLTTYKLRPELSHTSPSNLEPLVVAMVVHFKFFNPSDATK